MIKHELARTGSKNFYFLFIDHVHLIGKLQLGVFSEPEYALNGRFSLILTILLFVSLEK